MLYYQYRIAECENCAERCTLATYPKDEDRLRIVAIRDTYYLIESRAICSGFKHECFYGLYTPFRMYIIYSRNQSLLALQSVMEGWRGLPRRLMDPNTEWYFSSSEVVPWRIIGYVSKEEWPSQA